MPGPNHPCSRSGSALLTVVVILITLSALAVSMTNITVMGVKEQVKRYDKVSLLLSAESAVNAAISDLQSNYSNLIATELTNDKFADSAYHNADATTYTYNPDLSAYGADSLNGIGLSATITRLNTEPSDPDMIVFMVQGTASVGDPDDPMNYRRTRVETTIVPAPQTAFKQAMFAVEGYGFQGAATTDSWDSGSGSFGSGAGNGNEGDLGSEGDIVVQKPGNVNGTIYDNIDFPLPDFDYDSQLTTEGGIFQLNPYTDPITGDSVAGRLDDTFIKTKHGGTITLTESDSPYECSEISLSGNELVIVSGYVELYCAGPVNVSGNKSTQFITFQELDGDPTTEDSQLRLYQKDYSDNVTNGDVASSWDNNGGILGDAEPLPDNKPNDPKYDSHPSNLIVMSEYSGEFKMNGNGVFSGVFFVPQATVSFNGTFNYFGSIIAKSFDGKVNGTYNFHYDESLSTLDLDLTARLVMVGWRSYDLGYHFSD